MDGYVTEKEKREDEEKEKRDVGRRGDTYNFNIGNMHGSSLTIGDDNTSSVSVTNSFNSLPAEIQTALAELIRKTEETLSQVQDPEDKETLEGSLSSLKKSKPNKKSLTVTVKGLIAAAENIKNVSLPVLEVAAKVITLLNGLP